jgi:hypothetical protein
MGLVCVHSTVAVRLLDGTGFMEACFSCRAAQCAAARSAARSAYLNPTRKSESAPTTAPMMLDTREGRLWRVESVVRNTASCCCARDAAWVPLHARARGAHRGGC